MPSAQDIAAMAGMTGAVGGMKPTDARGLYEQWQQAIAELERLKGGGPQENIQAQYRMNPNTGEREYQVGGKWARQSVYEDPRFQVEVVEPWMEEERMRLADEYNKQIAQAQQAAAMHEYDYNDFQRRQQEHQENGVGKSTFGRPQGGGGMGSTSRRY